MRILIAAAVCIMGSVFDAYCGQDSVISARKAMINARQSAMSKAASAGQQAPAQPVSPGAAATLQKTNASPAATSTTAPSGNQRGSAASASKDSSAKPVEKNGPAAPVKSGVAQQEKSVAPEKKAGVEEEDLLIDESEEKKNPTQNAASPQQAVSRVQSDTVAAQKTTPSASDSQTNAPASPERQTSPAVAPSVAADTAAAKGASAVEKPMQPATIEAVRSINFAKNLKDYRSPKVAMFLSLLVPGLGQAYVKSYYKTALFVALEATAIGFSVAYNSKGKKQLDNAHAFADQNQNYDNDNLTTYYQGLFTFISGQNGGGTTGDSVARDKLFNIYFDSTPVFLQGSKHRWQSYYSDIQSGTYVQGWKDCEPKGDKIFDASPNTILAENTNSYKIDNATGYLVYIVDKNLVGDTSKTIYGYSPSQQRYISMVSQSNSYYKTAQGILFTLLVNHILSAVDALISAKAYNEALLGRETMWQHISIQQQLVDAGPSLSAGMVMRIQF